MSHNLMKDVMFGARFLGYREAGWHQLGQVVQEKLTAREAVIKTRLDYNVTLEDLFFRISEPDGSRTYPVDNQLAIVRHPVDNNGEYKVFGYVTDKYTPLSNLEIADYMDIVIDKKWHLETVGALGDGETFFMTVYLGEYKMPNGDKIKQYLLVKDVKNGRTKIKFFVVNLRVVCQNTMLAAERTAGLKAEFIHREDIHTNLDFRLKFMAELKRAREDTQAGLITMFNTVLNDDLIKLVLERVYRDAKRPDRAKLTDTYKEDDIPVEYHEFFRTAKKSQEVFEFFENRTQRMREGAMVLLNEFNTANPSVANTGYALYNAITELADWREGKSIQSASEGLMFGDRASEKIRAWETILSLPVTKK